MSKLKLKRFSVDPLMEKYTSLGEKWMENIPHRLMDRISDAIKDNKSGIATMNAWVVDNDHYVVKFHGGLNGSGKWEDYLYDISNIIKVLPGSYIIRLDTDVADDVWDLYLGVPLVQV